MDKALTEFIDKVRSAIKKRTYVKLLLTKRVLGNQDLNKIVVRYVELNNTPHLQFVYKYDRNDEAKTSPSKTASLNSKASSATTSSTTSSTLPRRI